MHRFRQGMSHSPNGSVSHRATHKKAYVMKMARSKEDDVSFHQNNAAKLKEEFVKMLQIIMSSKTKEEQQNEAFHRLRSNPELLLLLLQDIFNIDDREVSSPSPNTDNTPHQPSPSYSEVSSAETDRTEDTFTNIIRPDEEESIQVVQASKSPTKESEGEVTGKSDSESTEESFESYGDGIYPKRIRKSKYADIKGDLSHIRREPKCSKTEKEEKQLRSKLKKKENAPKKTKLSKQTKNNCQPVDNDVLLVRKFMDILMYPKSRNHQECVLAVLRSDPRLMKIFLKERANMGKQKIPVFKRTQCSGQNFSRTDFEVPQVEERDCNVEEISVSATGTSSGGTTPEDADSLLGFLISALKTNKVIPDEDISDRVSDKHRSHADRPSVYLSTLQNSNLEANQPLVRPVFSREFVPGAAPIAISSNAQEHHFSLIDGITERGQSPCGSEHSLESSGGDVTTFDISLHEHFQTLSRELFHVNNSTTE